MLSITFKIVLALPDRVRNANLYVSAEHFENDVAKVATSLVEALLFEVYFAIFDYDDLTLRDAVTVTISAEYNAHTFVYERQFRFDAPAMLTPPQIGQFADAVCEPIQTDLERILGQMVANHTDGIGGEGVRYELRYNS